MSATTVLIAGAGPTGLMLACELARRGVPFEIVEAADGPRPGSRGKGLQPRTLELFESLGIIDRILANGRLAMPMHAIAPDGTVTAGGAIPPSLAGRPDIPYPASLITPEWRVEEALRGRLAELGVSVRFGARLVGIEQRDGGVVATLESGDTIAARWLVGCDGGHSTVRKQSGIAFDGETREDVRMIVADVAADGLDRDAWLLWRAGVSLCPLPSTDVFQLQAPIAPGVEPDLSLGALQTLLDERSGRAGIRLREATWTSVWRANVRLAARYRAGAVLLAGDAAHIHSPAGGQGMNTGVQDAANLGWKLAAVVAGADESLLDTYEEERRPVAAHVLELSDARLRETTRTGIVPTTRDASTIQLDIGYRGSSIVWDDRTDTDGPRAGDRAPDATGIRTPEGERRLFDLLRGGGWTLLAFGGSAAAAGIPVRTIRVARTAGDPAAVVDSRGHLHSAYAARPGTLVLIRPDGYIGAIGDHGDAGAFVRYLRSVDPAAAGVAA